MNPFAFFTFTDDAGRWHWQRSGRFANPEGEGFATRELATDAARRRHQLEIIHQGEELARGRAQLAELEAELCGCRECHRLDKRHPREGQQLSLPGTRQTAIAAQGALL